MAEKKFQVSVIIPVYNAEKFLTKAVEAALAQDEVAEIILVEDASPDESLALCQKLEKIYPRVKAYQHTDKKNHGCGASRNFGLSKAKYDYVTFADADNFLLPNRFKEDKIIFFNDPSVDGTYNSMGVHYYSELAKNTFNETVKLELLTFSEEVPPGEVLAVLLGAHPRVNGSWGIDGLTIKKSLFEKSGVFNTSLRLQQDFDLYIKMSMVGKFVAANIDSPVCIRGVHDQQRSTDSKAMDHFRYERWKSVNKWLDTAHNVSVDHRNLFQQKFLEFQIAKLNGYQPKILFLKAFVKKPKMLTENFGFFDINFLNAFGRNWFTLRAVSVKNKFFNTK